jgi:hypothetical protein
MSSEDLGANEFTFAGDRTQITYLTQTPGPIQPGSGQEGTVSYQGPEGSTVLSGDQITLQASALGTLLTVLLRPNVDRGAIEITILIPKAFGVTSEAPVTFGTIAIKTTGRGFINAPGVEMTYDVLPLVGQARQVISPASPEGMATASSDVSDC